MPRRSAYYFLIFSKQKALLNSEDSCSCHQTIQQDRVRTGFQYLNKITAPQIFTAMVSPSLTYKHVIQTSRIVVIRWNLRKLRIKGKQLDLPFPSFKYTASINRYCPSETEDMLQMYKMRNGFSGVILKNIFIKCFQGQITQVLTLSITNVVKVTNYDQVQ